MAFENFNELLESYKEDTREGHRSWHNEKLAELLEALRNDVQAELEAE